ncbi:white collar one B [Phycomyces nitens]|nr:white collar one B [Phycomyces nitens]
MNPFENIVPFNPQLYESANVPPSTDRLFSYSGYTAGLMTGSQQNVGPSVPPPMFCAMPPRQPMPVPPTLATGPIPTPGPLPLPLPEATGPTNSADIAARYSAMYASTGFDMLSILARVANRPNPQINLGPVDLSCSFVVVDAHQYDAPIVYASPTFEKLTGYAPSEVVGRNCRFLQAPDGRVALGSRRKYTDNTTVYHIKTHISQGKESQASIINYRKTGQPFVNLLTVIPVAWESDEIDYFVGLQVDLVEQPNSIFDSMKDGTYMVNYRSLVIPQGLQPNNPMNQIKNPSEVVQEWVRPLSPKPVPQAIKTESFMDVETLIKEASTDEGRSRRCWHELLLDQSPDFIHVLTVKGIFLYCSEATKPLLEYDSNELLGKSLKEICHPSDIITVMRELKQSSSDASEPVNLIYRVKRKNSGYMWIECYGKLRNEDGRGRKYVVLSGRERPVYQFPRNFLSLKKRVHSYEQNAGMSTGTDDHEFWGKLSLDGLLLYASWTCANILGLPPSQVIGTSLYQLMRSNRTTDLTRALAEVKEGKVVYLRHALVNNVGDEIMVMSSFYPDGMSSLQEQPSFVLMQTKVIFDDMAIDEPAFVSTDPDIKKKGKASLAGGDPDNARTQRQQFLCVGEKVIEELDIQRDANWQYELHQLRINNKKLRDELGLLLAKAKKKERGAHGQDL